MKLKTFLRTHFYIFMKIIHSRLYPLFPLTKELLVEFLSVKVTWFISCFSGTLNKMLDLHRNSSSLQNQPTASSGKSELYWAVPCWSCGKPKKGLQCPCNALHVQVILLHPKCKGLLVQTYSTVWEQPLLDCLTPADLHQYENISKLHLQVNISWKVSSHFCFDVVMRAFLSNFDVPILSQNSKEYFSLEKIHPHILPHIPGSLQMTP